MDSLILITILCIALLLPIPTFALNCFCNECDGSETCYLSQHRDSNCFKSVHKIKENDTYALETRFGCLSGADDSLMSLQCQINTHNLREPTFIACCNDGDQCNRDLPDPNEIDDPRWILEPPQQTPPGPNTFFSHTYYFIAVIIGIAFVTCISCLMKNLHTRQTKTKCQNSIITDDYIERLKSHMVDNNSPPASRICTLSETISNKSDLPYEHSCASFEGTSTLPDLTSGVGNRFLEERTIARNIGSRYMLPVGSGRHGRVFMGEYHFNKVAVKAFRSIDEESWRREESILRKINHDNVVRWIASETVTVDDLVTETWMIIEFCPYGSLCDFLDHHEIANPEQAVKIVHSIIQGINYLHEDLYRGGGKPSIAHRDIKSRNILMKRPDFCCIADFGHAVVRRDDGSLDFGGNDRLQVGTVRYMAPEILRPEYIDTSQFFTFAQSDLYQFALVLWEIANRTNVDNMILAGPHRLPYDGVVTQNPDIDDMVKIVCEINYRPPISAHWNGHPVMHQLVTLMDECWKPNPKARMETLGVMKRVLDLYETLLPENMFQHMFFSNIIGSCDINSDKDHSQSSGDKTQTTVNMF